MQTTNKKILVTGATGRQGGAVARHLLQRGFQVLALTRDPSKPAARALAELGAELIKGDLDEIGLFARTLEGTHGIFSVQNFWETGYEREIEQGCNLADAASAMGIRHFVYSSVGAADRDTDLPHFESKWAIEEHIRDIGLPATILRPVFFMENFQNYLREPILKGFLPQPLDPEVPLSMIAVDDIGACAALAFENPEQWVGREFELAGDERTMPEVAEVFSRLLNLPVRYVQVPWEEFRAQAGEEMEKMYRWFNDEGYKTDIEAVRALLPQLHTLEQALMEQGVQAWSIAA